MNHTEDRLSPTGDHFLMSHEHPYLSTHNIQIRSYSGSDPEINTHCDYITMSMYQWSRSDHNTTNNPVTPIGVTGSSSMISLSDMDRLSGEARDTTNINTSSNVISSTSNSSVNNSSNSNTVSNHSVNRIPSTNVTSNSHSFIDSSISSHPSTSSISSSTVPSSPRSIVSHNPVVSCGSCCNGVGSNCSVVINTLLASRLGWCILVGHLLGVTLVGGSLSNLWLDILLGLVLVVGCGFSHETKSPSFRVTFGWMIPSWVGSEVVCDFSHETKSPPSRMTLGLGYLLRKTLVGS